MDGTAKQCFDHRGVLPLLLLYYLSYSILAPFRPLRATLGP